MTAVLCLIALVLIADLALAWKFYFGDFPGFLAKVFRIREIFSPRVTMAAQRLRSCDKKEPQ